MKTVVCDTEANSLTNPTKVWVASVKDVNSGEIKTFKRPDLNPKPFREYAENITGWIGHNFIAYDFFKVFNKFWPGLIDPLKIRDTLLLSRLIRYNVANGHSLEAWAERLKMPMKKEIEKWDEWTDDFIERCETDVEINFKLWKFLEPHLDKYKDAIELEHNMALVCEEMHNVGFHFNVPKANKLLQKIYDDLETLDKQILHHFPPKVVKVKDVTPLATKHGTINRKDFRGEDDLTPYSIGASFSRIRFEHFNPDSPKQIVERLNQAGWKPWDKTKGHLRAERIRNPTKEDLIRLQKFREWGWKVNEDNLNTLPPDAPEGARKLAERISVEARRRSLIEWLSCVREDDSRIHGTFNTIGSWTHRMSHQKPNCANVPSFPEYKDEEHPTPVELVKQKYNLDMRSCWDAAPGKMLVGVDAEGIQLRILAHYIEDEELIDALVSGDKTLRTDAHSLNTIKLGLARSTADVSDVGRNKAKRFIYAWVLGAGIPMVGHILSCPISEAKDSVNGFIESYPGLKDFKYGQLKIDEKRGYIVGLDGRLVPYPKDEPHKILAGYLQNGEAIIMKKARIKWGRELKADQIEFKPVDFVHDEWQTEIDDDRELADHVAKVQINSIIWAGEQLGLKCPLAGSSDFGYNWKETH